MLVPLLTGWLALLAAAPSAAPSGPASSGAGAARSQDTGAPAPPPAALLRTQIRGYARARASLLAPDVEGANHNVELRARPELILRVAEDVSATLTVSAERFAGRAEQLAGQGRFRLERAYVDVRLGRADVRAGRQAINFGSALIWNPVDLVDTNTALDFAVEKRGVDALRAAWSLSPTSSVLGLLAFPGGPDEPVISLARGEWLLGSTGVALIAAHDGRRDDPVLGADLKGDAGRLGVWLEGAAHFPAGAPDFYDVVLGADTSFLVRERLYLAAQLRRDSSGGTGVDDYDFLALATGRRAFLGRQYGSLLATLTWDELTSFNASAIHNFEDASFLATVSATRFFFENLEATARVSLLRGSGPGEFHAVGDHPLAGRLPSEVYELWLEWRF